jgi:hypothetical protein
MLQGDRLWNLVPWLGSGAVAREHREGLDVKILERSKLGTDQCAAA